MGIFTKIVIKKHSSSVSLSSKPQESNIQSQLLFFQKNFKSQHMLLKKYQENEEKMTPANAATLKTTWPVFVYNMTCKK